MTAFSELLLFHLKNGTRPGSPGDHSRRGWTGKEFAVAVGTTDRTVRNWTSGQTIPDQLKDLERAFFGELPGQTEARQRLREAWKGARTAATETRPFSSGSISSVPITVPRHFLGREGDIAAIDAALGGADGRAAITTLHGLRGVGKTTLAAAYAEKRRDAYRATWWIRAETETTMRADLVGLGVRLGWVAADAKEEPALEAVRDRLRDDSDGLLLIYDNAIDAAAVRPYLPRGGAARVLITSNSDVWRGLATPVEIDVWPKATGADYLIARTGRAAERAAAEALSETLGGLPLAHEQAAAYCERLAVPLAEYHRRFEAAPSRLLDDERDAPADYHNRLTAAKTFALAIEEAAKLHPAAEPLIVHAALLAPEAIPLFVFAEAREKFGEPLASALAGDGLDEAVAALRAFALIDREAIADERDPDIVTGCIRLHRLVRLVAAARRDDEARERIRGALIAAVAALYSPYIWRDPETWRRARRLDALAEALFDHELETSKGADIPAANLLVSAGQYRQYALAAYTAARPLYERALAIYQKALGAEHPDTAKSLNELARLLQAQGDLIAARPLYERALAIYQKAFGPEHPDTATSLNNLAFLLQAQGDLDAARPLFERTLAIYEKALGPEHPDTATSLNNLAGLLRAQGDLAAARPLFERALAIHKKALGPDHPDTGSSLNNLAFLLQDQGDLAAARPLFERALAICEKALGPDHPDTATSLNNLAGLLQAQGDLAAARPLYERGLAMHEKALGPEHPHTANSLNNLAHVLQAQGDLAAARPLFERGLAIREKVFGPEHPDTANSLHSLAFLLQSRGDLAAALPLYERALTIYAKALGRDHSTTKACARDTAVAPDTLGRGDEAAAIRKTCGLDDKPDAPAPQTTAGMT